MNICSIYPQNADHTLLKVILIILGVGFIKHSIKVDAFCTTLTKIFGQTFPHKSHNNSPEPYNFLHFRHLCRGILFFQQHYSAPERKENKIFFFYQAQKSSIIQLISALRNILPYIFCHHSYTYTPRNHPRNILWNECEKSVGRFSSAEGNFLW